MQLRRKRFDRPDEVREVDKARIDLVELGELAVGRAVFEPGWRWSEHVKPIVGTESCQVHHIGYVVSGHLHVEMTDGAALEVIAGDAFEISARSRRVGRRRRAVDLDRLGWPPAFREVAEGDLRSHP
jgi:quercetin dioxygenase-like cupin family protein